MPTFNVSYHFDPDLEEILVKNEHDEKIGDLQYHVEDQVWTVSHTGVDPNYRGGGIARELVDRIVEEARKANVKLTATCPYALHVLESSDDYSDIYSKK